MSAPDKALILRVATEEAAAAGVCLSHVLGMAISGQAGCARRRAILRVVRETGCSASGLAKAWGCDTSTVYRYLREGERPDNGGYDRQTAARLHWAHPTRAAQIIAGTDAQTNADIAAWRHIGGLA